jgi:hypothetical protein
MQRKKQSCGLNICDEWEAKEWDSKDQFSRSSATLTKKGAYKSYIQPSPTHSPSSTIDRFYPRQEKAPLDPPSELRDYLPQKLHKNSSQPKLEAEPDYPLPDRPNYNYDVDDLLRKYNGEWQERQLGKSKSGCLVQNYMKSRPQGQWGNCAGKTNVTPAAKENVMRRAEEEAARKIEEIERKARMKVLERKNQGVRREEEWGRSRPLY